MYRYISCYRYRHVILCVIFTCVCVQHVQKMCAAAGAVCVYVVLGIHEEPDSSHSMIFAVIHHRAQWYNSCHSHASQNKNCGA